MIAHEAADDVVDEPLPAGGRTEAPPRARRREGPRPVEPAAEPPRTLGEAMKQHARAAGLYQSDIARLLDVSEAKVSRWMTGTKRPNHEELRRFARAVGARLADYRAYPEFPRTERGGGPRSGRNGGSAVRGPKGRYVSPAGADPREWRGEVAAARERFFAYRGNPLYTQAQEFTLLVRDVVRIKELAEDPLAVQLWQACTAAPRSLVQLAGTVPVEAQLAHVQEALRALAATEAYLQLAVDLRYVNTATRGRLHAVLAALVEALLTEELRLGGQRSRGSAERERVLTLT